MPTSAPMPKPSLASCRCPVRMVPASALRAFSGLEAAAAAVAGDKSVVAVARRTPTAGGIGGLQRPSPPFPAGQRTDINVISFRSRRTAAPRERRWRLATISAVVRCDGSRAQITLLLRGKLHPRGVRPKKGSPPESVAPASTSSVTMPAGAKEPVYAPYVEHVPPDVTAQINLLAEPTPPAG
jgi:hypothetical protein